MYLKAAAAIKQLPHRIASGAEAKHLPGIGDKIAKKIDEWLETGALHKLTKIHDDPTAHAIQLLTGVHGVGPVAARAFVQRGVTTIEQLKSQHLNHAQAIGVKYYDDFRERIPRTEMDQLRTLCFRHISEVDGDAIMEVCGSYRRGEPTSGDIDVLLSHPDFQSTLTHKTPALVCSPLHVNAL